MIRTPANNSSENFRNNLAIGYYQESTRMQLYQCLISIKFEFPFKVSMILTAEHPQPCPSYLPRNHSFIVHGVK